MRFRDMDADRIVNSAVYLTYFEHARLAHLRRLGILGGPRRPGESTRSFTIAAAEVRYLAPTLYPETLRVTARTREVRNRSFIFAYEAVRVSDDSRVAEGSSVQVWLDAEGQAAPLPELVRAALVESVGDRKDREP